MATLIVRRAATVLFLLKLAAIKYEESFILRVMNIQDKGLF